AVLTTKPPAPCRTCSAEKRTAVAEAGNRVRPPSARLDPSEKAATAATVTAPVMTQPTRMRPRLNPRDRSSDSTRYRYGTDPGPRHRRAYRADAKPTLLAPNDQPARTRRRESVPSGRLRLPMR